MGLVPHFNLVSTTDAAMFSGILPGVKAGAMDDRGVP